MFSHMICHWLLLVSTLLTCVSGGFILTAGYLYDHLYVGEELQLEDNNKDCHAKVQLLDPCSPVGQESGKKLTEEANNTNGFTLLSLRLVKKIEN